MANKYLTRKETATYEFGRLIGNWQVLSEKAPENSACEDVFTETDNEFQSVADQVDDWLENEDVVFGIDENNESYILIPIPDRKPPGRPPSFP